MDLYFKAKIFSEYILPIALILLIGIITLAAATIDTIKESRRKNFFESNGYKRKLLDVPSVGNGAFYGWIRESDGKVADDRKIRHMKLKEIKEKYS